MTTTRDMRKAVRALIAEGYGFDNRTGEYNRTLLAEAAAQELGHDEWLDDDTHEIWDIALEEAEKAEDGGLGDDALGEHRRRESYGFATYRGKTYAVDAIHGDTVTLRPLAAPYRESFNARRREVQFRDEDLNALGDADTPGATTWSQIPRTAKVMIGARDAIVSEGGQTLSFKIGRNAKSINWIRIRLDPTDTYTMQFGRGLKNPRVVKTVDGVYYDQMLPVIEQYTGMRTGGIR